MSPLSSLAPPHRAATALRYVERRAVASVDARQHPRSEGLSALSRGAGLALGRRPLLARRLLGRCASIFVVVVATWVGLWVADGHAAEQAAPQAQDETFDERDFEDVLWLITEYHVTGRLDDDRWRRAINGALLAYKPPLRLTTRSLLLSRGDWSLRYPAPLCLNARFMLRRKRPRPSVSSSAQHRRWRAQLKQDRALEAKALKALKPDKALFDCVMRTLKGSVLSELGAAAPPGALKKKMTRYWGQAASAVVTGLDAHGMIIKEQTFDRLDRETGGVEQVGVGLVSQRLKGRHVVIAVQSGSPALEASVSAGHEIVSVAGRSARRWSEAKLSSALLGPEGSRVWLVTKSGGRTRRVSLIRRKVRASTVTGRLHGPDRSLWVISLKAFATGMGADLRALTKQLAAAAGRPPKALILDLRGNTGGHVKEGVSIADHFLSSGEITRLKVRGGPDEVHLAKRELDDFRWPVILLVDGRCRSACEQLTDALQAHGRALVVGDVTFGKGSAQRGLKTETMGPWNVFLTVGLFHGPDGGSVQRRGVTPDVSLPDIPAPPRREALLPLALPGASGEPSRRAHVSSQERLRLTRCLATSPRSAWSRSIERRDKPLAQALKLAYACL